MTRRRQHSVYASLSSTEARGAKCSSDVTHNDMENAWHSTETFHLMATPAFALRSHCCFQLLQMGLSRRRC
eukprot:5098942-Amphidinium_carterae.2